MLNALHIKEFQNHVIITQGGKSERTRETASFIRFSNGAKRHNGGKYV